MANDNKTVEHLQMAALEEGNHTHVADDIDYVMIIICRHGGVGSQTGHRVEPY
jgi:hypothetical protein